MQLQNYVTLPTVARLNSLWALIASLPPCKHKLHTAVTFTHKHDGLPFAIVIGNEQKLALHLDDPEVRLAFSSTALIAPAGLSEPFPTFWAWDQLTCAIFTRLHRWDRASISRNLRQLALQADKRQGLVVLHLEFESDLRCLNIDLEPRYILKL